MRIRILAATGNAHKLREIRAILQPSGIEVVNPAAVGGIPAVVEDGDSFEANAVKKAVEVAAAAGQCTLADDSGLEVAALGGVPGVYSSRYAGEDADDAANLAKLLDELANVRARSARFVCVVAVATPAGLVGTATGQVSGTIISCPRGLNGFGYDPVFVPDGHEHTFAELSEDVKNSESHRAAALRAALEAGLFARVADAPELNREREHESGKNHVETGR